MKKLKKYSKVAAVATLVPMTLTIGLSTQKNVEVHATQVTSAKVDSKNQKLKKPTVNRIVEEQRVITGKGLSNSEIRITLELAELAMTFDVNTDAKGNWSFEVPEGIDLIRSMSVLVSQKGYNGQYSDIVDKAIEIVNLPKVHKIDTIHVGQKVIKGKAVPGNRITVPYELTAHHISFTYADANGNWEIPLSDNVSLKAGQKIEIRQARPNGAGEIVKTVIVKK